MTPIKNCHYKSCQIAGVGLGGSGHTTATMNDSTVAATKTIKEEAETSAGMFIIPTNTPKKSCQQNLTGFHT